MANVVTLADLINQKKSLSADFDTSTEESILLKLSDLSKTMYNKLKELIKVTSEGKSIIQQGKKVTIHCRMIKLYFLDI